MPQMCMVLSSYLLILTHLLCTRTTPIFELDLHFGPNYISAKFCICISTVANQILLTQRNRPTLPGYSQSLMRWSTPQDVSPETHTRTHRQTCWERYQLLLSQLVVIRHGHGSTFWNPTQPNPPKYKPNPTHNMLYTNPTQPNPFPYVLSRDYIVCHTVNFLVQSTHTISPQNINVRC